MAPVDPIRQLRPITTFGPTRGELAARTVPFSTSREDPLPAPNTSGRFAPPRRPPPAGPGRRDHM